MQRTLLLSVILSAAAAIFSGCDSDEEIQDNPPQIESFSPDSGLPGATVTIGGKNFSSVPAENEVSFNGTVAEIGQASATSLTVVVPAGASTGKISIKRGQHTAVSASDFTVLVPAPAITSFSPEGGTVETVVTITGERFSSTASNNAVFFNDTPVTTIVSASPTELVVKVPSGFTTGKIKVVVDGRTSLSATDFYFYTPLISDFEPRSGKKGETVVITGSHFSPAHVSVNFNGRDAELLAATQTTLTVKVPAGASTGKIQVTVNGASISSSETFEYVNVFTVTTFVGGTQGDEEGQGTNAKINYPRGIHATGGEGIVLTEWGTHRIRKISFTGVVTNLSGSGESGYQDGTGANAYFNNPAGVLVGFDGNLYVADNHNDKIRKVSLSTGQTTTFAGGERGSANGTGTAASFHAPRSIVQDAHGNFYVADAGNHRIRKITPQGVVTTLAGSEAGFADGSTSNALFNGPSGLVMDSQGNLYVADTQNHRIRKITPDGTVTTVAGSTIGFTDGQGENAKFNNPVALAIDGLRNLYVADMFSNAIRKITLDGKVTTVAGGGVSGFVNGDGKVAKFNMPAGLVFFNESLYVCDYVNHAVRKITIE